MEWGWIWITVLLLAIAIELATHRHIAIAFVPASVICAVIDFFLPSIAWQSAIFASASIICLAVLSFVRIHTNKLNTAHLDTIVGEKCIVTEKIDTFSGCGHARVKGQVWSARGINNDDVFEVGTVLKIVGIEGVKLICKRN